ncbi:30S ribosomal protein S15 [Candidatus Saccharibacteria bacterium]|jgi:small subunit ribosomal protein S15|nr:30S ribosomal protein S15 [Candidatus Saccharibacteria bacterium]
MLEKTAKQTIIKDAARDKDDSGSPEVQVSIMSARISELTEHLKIHKKDDHSRRGLLQLVGKRKRLLKYLKRENYASYEALIKKLGIRSN